IASALLEAYRITKRLEYLNTAIDTQYFILKDINRTYDKDGDFSFSYSPLDKTQVFNASLLGSRLLSQIYGHTKDENLLTEARKSVSFAAKHQQKNGEWAYGTLPFHQWIDSFHTGYNLECIHAYQQYSGDKSFDQVIESGTNYYLKNFFTSKGIPKYYDNRIYPIDVHATSQLIITLSRLKIWDENIDLIKSVLMWTIINMQDPKGYFYYQLKKNFNSKIPYMRWAQAWMFYAFTEFLLNENTSELATNSKVTFQVIRNEYEGLRGAIIIIKSIKTAINQKIKSESIMESKKIPTVNIMNCPIHSLTMDQTIKEIENNIKLNKQIHHVVVNAAKLVNMQTDKTLYDSVVNCDIINADGQSVVWASRILKQPLPERVAGADLMINLIDLAGGKGYKVFLFCVKE